MISRSKHRSSIEVCSDCGASEPSWASINRGLLLCAECCSVHRSMGRHISHVKSLRQGSWPPSLLAMVQALTAQNVNSIWEHSLLDTSAPKHLRKKPQPKDPLHPIKSEFILAKHLRLAYVLRARRDEPPGELGRQLHSAVRSASLDTAMRLLAQGADPNYYSQEKGCACLHVACRAGQPAQAELLVAWGAEPTARDAAGYTPADCARAGGHAELAERMAELVLEATDRLAAFLTGERPPRAAVRRYALPRARDHHLMTDVAKAARGKLQLLPNHLFEELVMDIYDEVDRRETEEMWQREAGGSPLERCGVAFLPVNPALSAPRNQGRQKLARLSPAELAALLRDVLLDAERRQRLARLHPAALPGAAAAEGGGVWRASQLSDDEPLYDSVASDDDYAALAPAPGDHHMSTAVPRTGAAVCPSYSPSLPLEHSEVGARGPLSPTGVPDGVDGNGDEIQTLRKELDSRDSTITELKNQLKNLQTIVEQLTKENSVLKTTSSVDDDLSMTSQTSLSEGATNVDGKLHERGRSLETEQLTLCEDDVDLRQCVKGGQRPVSMYETREGPRNNWQGTKHQLTTAASADAGAPLERSLTASALDDEGGAGGGECGEALPPGETVQARAEGVTRAIQALWAAARHQPEPELAAHADCIHAAVHTLLDVFPQPAPLSPLCALLQGVRGACGELQAACCPPAPIHRVRHAAYELARATKLLVTHCA